VLLIGELIELEVHPGVPYRGREQAAVVEQQLLVADLDVDHAEAAAVGVKRHRRWVECVVAAEERGGN